MPRRDTKRVRGKSVDWDELKERHNINLTKTAWDALEVKAGELGISRSEVIERTVRGLIVWNSSD